MIMKKIWRMILVCLVMANAFFFCRAKDFEAVKWEVLDIDILVDKPIANPFTVEFGAVIENEAGVKKTVPGFYNGDSTWVIRFCPDQPGVYHYTTYSELAILTGHEGKIIVKPNTHDENHGPVRVSEENPRKFEYADGTPYIVSAFELDWLYALDHDNKEGIPNTEKIISWVKSHGFNQVVMNVFAYDARWKRPEGLPEKYDFGSPATFPFAGTNDEPDFSTLNVEFFQHLDRVMHQLNDQRMVAHLMIYVWNKMVNWPGAESKADNMYFDHVVRRYQAFPNLAWDISKEALAYGRDDMGYISRRIERLKRQDAHGRLLTVHDYNYCSRYPEKVDYISIQDWSPDIYNVMRKVAEKYPSKPIFNIEHGGYELGEYHIYWGAYDDPLTCLDRHYQCYFAGTYATYYWQGSSWYHVIVDPWGLEKEYQPKAMYYKHMMDFFTEYDYQNLEPVKFPFGTYGLTDNEKWYIFYLPENLRGIFGEIKSSIGNKAKLTWFDPIEGTYHQDDDMEIKGKWIGKNRPREVKSPMCIAIFEIIE